MAELEYVTIEGLKTIRSIHYPAGEHFDRSQRFG
jgi:hypothetical protein